MNVKERIAAHELRLLQKHRGTFVSGADLRDILGFRTPAAFRQAVYEDRLPVPTFVEAGRRGRFARIHDLAVWLAQIDDRLDQNQTGSVIRSLNEEDR